MAETSEHCTTRRHGRSSRPKAQEEKETKEKVTGESQGPFDEVKYLISSHLQCLRNYQGYVVHHLHGAHLMQ